MPNTKEKGKLIEVLSKHIPYGYATLCLIADELMTEGVTFATDNNVGDKWIWVKDRMPEGASTVLAVDLDGTIATAYYVGRWHGGGDLDENAVIGWMPLPSPPTCKDCKFYEKECEDHSQSRILGQERGMEICEIFCYLPQPPKGD
jgi:hypothetical protein